MANQITVVGNLTRDAEVKEVDGKGHVLEFNLADNWQKDKDPNFFRCGYWMKEDRANKLKEYMKKGQKLTVFGHSFNGRAYLTKEKEPGIGMGFRVHSIEFMSSGEKSQTSGKDNDLDDEIPF